MERKKCYWLLFNHSSSNPWTWTHSHVEHKYGNSVMFTYTLALFPYLFPNTHILLNCISKDIYKYSSTSVKRVKTNRTHPQNLYLNAQQWSCITSGTICNGRVPKTSILPTHPHYTPCLTARANALSSAPRLHSRHSHVLAAAMDFTLANIMRFWKH